MAYQPINRSQIVQALQEFGPMTRYELAEHLGWTVEKVGTTISSTRHLKPGQVFRIVGYEQGVRVVACLPLRLEKTNHLLGSIRRNEKS